MLSLQTSRDKCHVANYRLLLGCLIWRVHINTHSHKHPLPTKACLSSEPAQSCRPRSTSS